MPQNHIDGRRAGKTLRRTLLPRGAGTVALAVLAVCTATAAARAGDGDDDGTMSTNTPFYDKVLQVIGVGSGSNIDYGERSPLVVPPTRDLPPPVADRAPSMPDWPKDPDLQQRARAKVKEKVKPHPDYAVTDALPLRPDQLNVPGGNNAAASATGPRGVSGYDYPEAQNHPTKGVFSLNLFAKKKEYATFTGEPARTSLTEPPPGYLTPSPDQPYGIGADQKKYKVPTVADRAAPISGTEQSR